MASYPSRTPGELGTLTDRIDALEGQLRRVLSPTAEQYAQAVESLKGVVKTATETAAQAAATAKAIPVVSTTSDTVNGVGLTGLASGAWKEFLTLNLDPIPAGKTSIDGIFTATASVNDASSGGVSFINARLRVQYPDGTEYSETFYAYQQFGSYSARNSVIGVFHLRKSGLEAGDVVKVGVQLNASTPASFPAASGNTVSASVVASAANL